MNKERILKNLSAICMTVLFVCSFTGCKIKKGLDLADFAPTYENGGGAGAVTGGAGLNIDVLPTATTQPIATLQPIEVTQPTEITQPTGTPQPTPAETPMIKMSDNPAPDFTVTLLDGSEFTLSDQLGNVVFLNFWATWCGPCMQELPEIQSMYEKYGDEVVFLGIDLSEDEDNVIDVINEKGLEYMFAIDDDYETVSMQYDIVYIPYTAVIGRDGAIVAECVGSMTEEVIEGMLLKALE